jgi:hypothetical protein
VVDDRLGLGAEQVGEYSVECTVSFTNKKFIFAFGLLVICEGPPKVGGIGALDSIFLERD